MPFSEVLRRELANDRRPARVVLQVRCERRHPLLWLVPSRWGLVPVTRTSDEPAENPQAEVTELPVLGGRVVRKTAGSQPGRFTQRFHTENSEPGRPRTLQEWQDDRPLPAASCPCYAEVVLSVLDVKTWLSSGLRSVTYRRSVARV